MYIGGSWVVLTISQAREDVPAAKTPKLVAEWADRSGTRFLLRTRIEIANEEACRIQEHYETEEVTPDVVEGLGVLDPWRGFQETRPEEWKLHNQHVHGNWEKEKKVRRKVEQRKREESLERLDGSGWYFPRFWHLFSN